MEWIEQAIKSAERLGSLSSGAIWAFIALYFVWDAKQKKESADKAWAARTKEAEADTMMVAAIEKMSEEIKELRQEIRFGRKNGV
jgi:hypothetical protein